MAIQVVGNSGVVLEVDPSRNLPMISGERGYSVGGEYIVTGAPTAVVAAALAANSALMSMRLSTSSPRKAYVTRMRIFMSIPTAGAAGGVPTILSIQRFTAATPTGGTARTVDKKNAAHPSASDMTDVRDSNAALTVTSVVFGDLVASTLVPNAGTNTFPVEWIFEPDEEPLVLAAGDGLALRTQSAGPATATWMFAYSVHWYEK